MLRVSGKQLAHIATHLGLDELEDEMVVHLSSFVPRFSEILGKIGVRRCVRFGVERASVYGVTNPGLLRFYIELMFMYGGLFDTDPYIPWAGPILRDPDIHDQSTRMSRLYQAMLWYLDNIGGPKRAYATGALRNLHRLRLANFPTAALRANEAMALDALREIYPQRFDYLGTALMKQLVHAGEQEAARRGVGTERGIVLVTGMMFAMGHGFAEDPLLPWITTTLTDPTTRDVEKRVARLERRTQIYLDKAIEHLDRSPNHVL